jgi:peptide chain release factor 2
VVGFDLDGKRKRLSELEKASHAPDLWNDPQRAQEVMQGISRLREEIAPWEDLQRRTAELLELIVMAQAEEEESLVEEIERDVAEVQRAYGELEFLAMFSGKYDHNNAILSVNAGAGGTEAMDWAAMLVRMYTRWAQRSGYTVEVVDESAGEEAGIKGWTAIINGSLAYGYLKAERGVHRLIRLSPFDADHARHTSFAAVDVMPELTGEMKVEIKPEDLKIETKRSGGPGGQHAQKNETAVVIIHLPTGITAQSQNERSQLRNKEMAMKVLEARLFERMWREQQEELAKLRGETHSISFGRQIRTYTLHPYNLVKDHRTDAETSNVAAVLDGDLDMLMRRYLQEFGQEE